MPQQLTGIKWELANPFGIAIDEQNDIWHSGHVTDILELDNGESGVLIATDRGGVWTISTNGMTVALSNNWDYPDTYCLAQGLNGNRHFFAGCTDGIIMETDVRTPAPLLNWRPISEPLPRYAGTVNALVVLNRHRKIIAACDGGIFWSNIPEVEPKRGCLGSLFPNTSPPPPPPYYWTRADEDYYEQNGYFDIAVGSLTGRTERHGEEDLPAVSIVAGGNKNGIFIGRWRGTNLTMRRAVVVDDQGRDDTSSNFAVLGATSVAVCEFYPRNLYAASANLDGRLRSVFRSTDGGARWTVCRDDLQGSTSGMRATAGAQGNKWNNCIGVLPSGPGIVAVGWVAGFLSVNAGKSWIRITGSRHLHEDMHVVKFKPTTGANEHFLYIGSDGGIAKIKTDDILSGLTPPFAQSDYNRLLPTHQCYATVVRQFYGTMGVSPVDVGLISTGVHDNGNIAAFAGPRATPWTKMASGDGGWNGIVADGGLLHNIMGSSVQAHQQAGGKFIPLGVPPITVPPPNDPNGVGSPVADVVRRPAFRNESGQKMLAVAGTGFAPVGQKSSIYGLFVSAIKPFEYHWEYLGALASNIHITAVASLDGTTIFGGTTESRIFAFDTRQGTAIETPIYLPKPVPGAIQSGGTVTRIVETPDHSAFALLNAVTFSAPAFTLPEMAAETEIKTTVSYVLRLESLKWVPTSWVPSAATQLADRMLFGLEVVTITRPHIVFVSTDNQVYGSTDDGNTWKLASTGLPKRPHCADLRRVFGSDFETGWLYLSTFGRSVWRTRTDHVE